MCQRVGSNSESISTDWFFTKTRMDIVHVRAGRHVMVLAEEGGSVQCSMKTKILYQREKNLQLSWAIAD